MLTGVVAIGIPAFSEKMVPVNENEFTVTTTGNEVSVHDPLFTWTVYDPEVLTTMD